MPLHNVTTLQSKSFYEYSTPLGFKRANSCLNFSRSAEVNYLENINIQRYGFMLKDSKIVTEYILKTFNIINRKLVNSSIQVENVNL